MLGTFSKNSLLTFFTEVLIFIFGFLALIIIARVLGPEKKGIYSLIILIPSLLLTFGSFGIESANVYFVGRKKYKIEDFALNSLISAFFLGIILVLIFFGVSQFDFFQKFINSNQIPSFYLWLVVLIIPLSLLSSFFRNILRGKGDLIGYNKIRIVENAVPFLAVIILLLILKQDLFGAVFSYVLAVICAAFFSIFLIKKITKFCHVFNKKLFKDSVSYGGKVYLANSLSFLNYRLDMLLIAMFLSPVAVGIYSISVAIAEKLFIIPGALSTVLFPTVSSMNGSEANNLTSKVVRHTFFIMFFVSLLLLFLAKPLIAIVFGTAFASAAFPLMILLPGILAFSVGGVLAADLSGRGKPQFAIYSSLTCLIVNIILNIIFIPKWGIAGAAFASAISYWVDTMVVLIAFLKISKKPLTEVLLVNKEDLKDYMIAINNLKNWLKSR